MRWLPLDPPRLQIGAGLRWTLSRAFGHDVDGVFKAGDGAALAEALGLGARIAYRHDWQRLATEIDEPTARRWTLQLLQRRGSNRVLDEAMKTVAACSLVAGIELIWLKHAGLRASSVVQEGQREARDVDVLVHPSVAVALYQSLLRSGFRSVGEHRSGHCLPPLVNAAKACVEIHTVVPGFDVGVFWSNSVAMAPSNELLAAHALVHGLLQHLTSPETYSPVRVLADAMDLRIWELSARTICNHAPTLDEQTVACMQALSEGLAKVDSSLLLDRPLRRLLEHIVAASLDSGYRAALAARRVGEMARAGSLLGGLRRLAVGGRPWSSERQLTGTTATERFQKARRLLRGAAWLMIDRVRRP